MVLSKVLSKNMGFKNGLMPPNQYGLWRKRTSEWGLETNLSPGKISPSGLLWNTRWKIA